MIEAPHIEVRGLTKRYGDTTAVEDLTFTVRPGLVTGFLGPNGAGKSTTMRLIVGLDAPTSGEVLINGGRYRDLRHPLRSVGALLDARAVHPGRSAHAHLLALARTNGIRRGRVDEVIDAVGLRPVAHRRAGGFSLGMGQRLGIASALLGDPATILLDEPVNGLDPDGIRWIRSLLRELAAEGRTVLVSSHLLSEVALTAQHLIVLGRGRLIADTSTADFLAEAAPNRVRVRTTAPERLAAALRCPDVDVDDQAAAPTGPSEPGTLVVTGLSTDQIGRAAAAEGLTLLELTAEQVSLEDAFLDLTKDAVEYQTGGQR